MALENNSVTIGQQLKSAWKEVLSLALGYLILMVGIIVGGYGFSEFIVSEFDPEKLTIFAVGLVIIASSFLVKLPWILFKQRGRIRNLEQAQAAEALRLEQLRKSMTPGEWEAYKLQLENQRLLASLNGRASEAGSGGKIFFGISQEFSD
jgi:cytochrome c biogenesis protein CcdA